MIQVSICWQQRTQLHCNLQNILRTGTLTLVDIQSSLGALPRHFNFDQTGHYLMSGMGIHASDSDNLVVFSILETGKLKMVDIMENVPSIVWITPVSAASE